MLLTLYFLRDISGSDGGEYEDDCILGCSTTVPVRTTKTSAKFCETIGRNIPDNSYLRFFLTFSILERSCGGYTGYCIKLNFSLLNTRLLTDLSII
jgi:hypothetical protein